MERMADETKTPGDIRLDYAFQIEALYDPPRTENAPKGIFRYQDIVSGTATGPRMKAAVYAHSGGQYDTVTKGGVRTVDARWILSAPNGERIYVEHFGYRRPDGYYRAVAFLDADTAGSFDWVNDTTFVVTAVESPDTRKVVFTYYVAN